MAATPTTIPSLTAEQLGDRAAAVYPSGWTSPQARTPGGVMAGLLMALGTAPAFDITSLQYALAATRIQTAQNDALDLASLDFFGPAPAIQTPGVPNYSLPRQDGETDASYSARIMAALLPDGATRPAVTAAVQATSGYPPRVVEPWRPADTGVWDPAVGSPMAFWDVDTPANPFRWTDPGLGYQGFIDAVLPQAQPFGNNPTPCYDTAPFFWDVPNQYGIYFIDPEGSAALGSQVVYQAINRAKCEGTIVWVKFVPAPTASWDQPGESWDTPGQTWGP